MTRQTLPGVSRCLVLSLCLAGAFSLPSWAQVPWMPGETRPVRALGSNRGSRVEVLSVALLDHYGETAAPAGRRFVVLRARWENTFPLTLIEGKDLPTEYRVPVLGDHVYLVADGREVLRLLPGAADLPGHLPVSPFSLPRLGSVLEGNLVFDAADPPFSALELRFYDFAHGHFAVPLGASAGPPAQPLGAPLKNEVVEIAPFAVQRAKELGGTKAPDGMTFLTIDLRARSLFTVDADATAFDPKARPGARAAVGTVADWKESRRYLQLVADGEIGFPALPVSLLAEEPRFLPDVFTGGTVSFLAPENATSLELRCDFPNARSSLDGKEFRPRGLTLHLEGKRPGLPALKPLLGPITDDPFSVTVTAMREGEPGQAQRGDTRLVLLEVTASNTGKIGDFLQTSEQLQLVLASGQQVALDPTASPARPATSLLWVPPGERRSFTAAFHVPVAETRLRLMYRGGNFAKTYDLPATAAPAAVAALPDAPPAPRGTETQKPAATQPPRDKAASPAPAAGPPPTAPRATPPPASSPGAPPPAGETKPQAERIPGPRREPKGLAGVGLTPEQVNEAIDRGADFLWRFIVEKDFKENRRKLGDEREHAISALALVHSGAHKRHADFDAELRRFLAEADVSRINSYEAGIFCMLVEAYGDPSFLPFLEKSMQLLLDLQGEQGSWSYYRNFPSDFFNGVDERILKVTGGRPLEEQAPPAAPRGRKTPWKEGADGDNSASQYALLGLQAASRSGYPIEPEVWKRALAIYRERQGQDGNWAYNSKSFSGYGSMTCAGICAIALTRHALGEKDPAADPAIDHGLAWLEKNFSLIAHAAHQPPDRWRYYYLYSLERVGRILDVDFIGPHEWYPLGARHLLDTRTEDGGWVGKQEELDPRLATSFALLFLTRATPSLQAAAVARGGDGTLKTGIELPRGSRYYFILDASGSMTTEMDGKTKWEIARQAVSSLVSELPENTDVALRVYGHRKRAIDPGASEDTALEVPLRRLVRKDLLAKIDSLKPRGKTPLALSLREAARDLSGATPENPVTLVLLTDGGEDTLPRQDPVAGAAEIGKLRGVRFHLVGFDIGREDWKGQLQEMARKGEGRYWPAGNAASLLSELRSAVFGVPLGFSVATAGGKEAGAGRFGDSLTLREGQYLFRSSYAGIDYEETFWINTAQTTSVVFNAARVAQLRLPPPAAQVGKPAPAAAQPAAPATSDKPAAPGAGPKPRFCSDCGKPLAAAARFCASCGKKVGN